jgi:predicted nucleic-acid-binding protein
VSNGPSITVDTNILVRVLLDDDHGQSAIARSLLLDAKQIVIPIPVLCELVWVLTRVGRFSNEEIAHAVNALAQSANVVTDRAALLMGLSFLQAGGDFADGAIASVGQAMGGDTFVSFDRHAVALATLVGINAQIPT